MEAAIRSLSIHRQGNTMSTHTQARIPYAELAPKAFKSLYALSNAVHEASLGHRLIELVFLRVSQVNGCGFCVDMHWQALTKLDLNPRLLNAVAAWRETPFFDARERAALHWAEIVTDISRRDASDEEFAALRTQFSDAEIAELGFAIATINAWNRLAVSFRQPLPAAK
jgi:AhpD family alkylhydroperoxidase